MNHTNFIKKIKQTQYNKKIIIILKRLNKPKKTQRMIINQNMNEKIYFLKKYL